MQEAAGQPNFRRGKLARYCIFGGVVLCISIFVFYFYKLKSDPRVVVLFSERGAEWIRADVPIRLDARDIATMTTMFRTDFSIPSRFGGGMLRIAALRRVLVNIDDVRVFDTGPHVPDWKTTRLIPLPPGLRSGPHKLQMTVVNLGGPCLVRVGCQELPLRSGARWEAKEAKGIWKPAVLASQPWDTRLGEQFNTTAEDMKAMFPLLVFLFGFGCVIYVRAGQWMPPLKWAAAIRWGLLLAWLVLCVQVLLKVPTYVGFDSSEQLEYIRYVAEHGRLPLATEGWQYFQAPFYYMISAMLLGFFRLLGTNLDAAVNLLRTIPLVCGAAMVEISYRTARHAFPNRTHLWIVATAAGGLLPVNLYMAQGLSNEPLAAMFCGLTILYGFRFLCRPADAVSVKQVLLCGVLLGLAILTKITALIWIGPLCGALVVAGRRAGTTPRAIVRSLAVLLSTSSAICGWYFVRNWIELGSPIYTHSVQRWWQDPGYRTPWQLMEFGHVFSRPVYSGMHSVWDSLYSSLWANGLMSGIIDFDHRPPCNYRLMSCGLWLAIIPTLALIVAIIRVICTTWVPWKSRSTEEHDLNYAGLWFAISILVFLLAAIIHLYLTLPAYSVAKASYMLGATPCFAVLIAAGYDWIARPRWLRLPLAGAFACWAVVSYLTYFAV